MPSICHTKTQEFLGMPVSLRSAWLDMPSSPIDLIPDPIPILGYLDDLILVPLGIFLVLKMIPKEVMAECREQAKVTMLQNKPLNWVAATVIIEIWVGLAILSVAIVSKYFIA